MTVLRILLSSPYNTFLAAAILLGLFLAMRDARGRGIPRRDWALLLGVALASGLFGSKLVFLDFRPISPGEKTIVGALLVGIVAVLAAARALRIGAWRALDGLSVPTLAAMAVGRIGCFLAGCCAGTETVLPWGVRSANSDVHVHPVQLYEMAADLVLIGVLRRRVPARRDGVRFVAAGLGYAVIRIGTESVRGGREHYAGFTAVQWSLFLLAVVLVAIAISRSRTMVDAAPAGTRVPLRARSSALAVLGVASGLAIISIGTGAWLVPFERLTVLAIASALTVTALAAMSPGWAPRVLSLLLAPQAGAYLMMQQVPVDSTPRRELLVGAAMRGGAYDQLIGREYGTDCDGAASSWPTLASRKPEVTEAHIGIRERLASGNHVTVEARSFNGTDRLQSIDSGPVSVVPVPRLGISGYGGSFEYEHPSGSVRLGLASGTFVSAGERSRATTPTLLMRFGDDRRWFFQGNLADRRYFPTLGEFSYLGVGFTGGRGRPRLMFGVGEGGMGQLVLPYRGFELDVGFRSLTGREDGSGTGDLWTVGVRQAITLKR